MVMKNCRCLGHDSKVEAHCIVSKEIFFNLYRKLPEVVVPATHQMPDILGLNFLPCTQIVTIFRPTAVAHASNQVDRSLENLV